MFPPTVGTWPHAFLLLPRLPLTNKDRANARCMFKTTGVHFCLPAGGNGFIPMQPTSKHCPTTAQRRLGLQPIGHPAAVTLQCKNHIPKSFDLELTFYTRHSAPHTPQPKLYSTSSLDTYPHMTPLHTLKPPPHHSQFFCCLFTRLCRAKAASASTPAAPRIHVLRAHLPQTRTLPSDASALRHLFISSQMNIFLQEYANCLSL